MAVIEALYGKYSDSVLASATVSLSAGTASSTFPLVQLYDGRPDKPFKATSAACTIRATFGSAKIIQGIFVIWHNLHGLTLTVTNNGGMASQNLVMPAATEDSFPVNGWWDGRVVSSNSATQWDVAITGAAANVAIGELIFLQTVRTLPIEWTHTEGESHPTIVHKTAREVKLKSTKSVRVRSLTGRAYLESDRAAMASLRRGTLGQMRGFALVPDATANDSLMVTFTEDLRSFTRQNPGFTDQPIAVEEMCCGVVL